MKRDIQGGSYRCYKRGVNNFQRTRDSQWWHYVTYIYIFFFYFRNSLERTLNCSLGIVIITQTEMPFLKCISKLKKITLLQSTLKLFQTIDPPKCQPRITWLKLYIRIYEEEDRKYSFIPPESITQPTCYKVHGHKCQPRNNPKGNIMRNQNGIVATNILSFNVIY